MKVVGMVWNLNDRVYLFVLNSTNLFHRKLTQYAPENTFVHFPKQGNFQKKTWEKI